MARISNVEEMDDFLATYNVPSLSHEDRQNLNRTISSKDIESVITTSQQKNEPDGVTGEFFQTFKEILILILLKLF